MRALLPEFEPDSGAAEVFGASSSEPDSRNREERLEGGLRRVGEFSTGRSHIESNVVDILG